MFVAEMLSIASLGDCQMGAALIAGKWQALVALGDVRLVELPLGLESEDEARCACYLALEMHTGMKRAARSETHTCLSADESLPRFEDIQWIRAGQPQNWIDSYFAKPVWPAQPINTASRPAYKTVAAS